VDNAILVKYRSMLAMAALMGAAMVAYAQQSSERPRALFAPCALLETSSADELEWWERLTHVLTLDVAPYDCGAPIARLIVQPSFDPEWAVSVYHPADNECRVILVVAETNVSYANQEVVHGIGGLSRHPAKVAATADTAPISCDIADRVGLVWGSTLNRLVRPKAADPMLVDGTSYTATRFTEHNGYVCGRVGSPPQGSPADRLNALGAALADYVRADKPNRPKIVKRIRLLAEQERKSRTDESQ